MNVKNGCKDLKRYLHISRRVRDTLARLAHQCTEATTQARQWTQDSLTSSDSLELSMVGSARISATLASSSVKVSARISSGKPGFSPSRKPTQPSRSAGGTRGRSAGSFDQYHTSSAPMESGVSLKLHQPWRDPRCPMRL